MLIIVFVCSMFNQKWQQLNDELTTAINEATDNVKFVASLEVFYDPLYREPEDIHNHVDNLLKALRSVYNTSQFYNSSNSIASFLVKCTNHLTNVCKAYINNNGTISVFSQTIEQLNGKIDVRDGIFVNKKVLTNFALSRFVPNY